jgi:SAM-dependent methyltransferase
MLDGHDLRKISQTTLAHYDDTADAFWEGTRDHDVTQNIQALLSVAHFDGVVANASLFHVPTQVLPRVLGDLRATLRPGGVLFSSNPHGRNDEGWNRGRYGSFLDLETWRALVTASGFVELEHYYRPPGLPRAQQPWLATVWRRT